MPLCVLLMHLQFMCNSIPSVSQVDEFNKHGADDNEFSRKDEIMCSVLEDIS